MYKTDIGTLKKETEVFRFGASTKGGQRANRKETGIHLRHIPSGIEVRVIEERSQARNLAIAFERLRERLEQLNRPEIPRIPTKVPKSTKRERLKEKKAHSEKKQLRKKPILG
ncbi:MAG: peptide chain release factor-like protein [bacterium]|nr:peptide chain release factor-like protein [bacterium]